MDTLRSQQYREIWERYGEEMWRFIQSRLRGAGDQEDTLQEVFLAFYQKLEAGAQIKNVRAWLYRTAYNQCCSRIHDLQQSRERLVSMDDDLWRNEELCDPGADPAIPTISKEQLYEWRDALLARLEEDERAFLEDFYIHHLPVADIMRKWNIQAATAYQRKRRLLLKLQRMARELMDNQGW